MSICWRRMELEAWRPTSRVWSRSGRSIAWSKSSSRPLEFCVCALLNTLYNSALYRALRVRILNLRSRQRASTGSVTCDERVIGTRLIIRHGVNTVLCLNHNCSSNLYLFPIKPVMCINFTFVINLAAQTPTRLALLDSDISNDMFS